MAQFAGTAISREGLLSLIDDLLGLIQTSLIVLPESMWASRAMYRGKVIDDLLAMDIPDERTSASGEVFPFQDVGVEPQLYRIMCFGFGQVLGALFARP